MTQAVTFYGLNDVDPVLADDPKVKQPSPFSYVDAFTIDRKNFHFNNEAELVGYDQFVINRYLSMNESTCELALLASKAQPNLSNLDHYRLMLNALPAKKLYIKWLNRKGDDKNAEVVAAICSVYDVGNNDATAMLSLLTDSEIKQIMKTAKIFSQSRT